jgi:sugar phosphate isomerase/epimerase
LTISRRALLTFLPGLALAESLSRPATHFPTNSRDRLAVTSWPFRDYISSPGNLSKVPVSSRMDLKQFPAFVARRFGVYNINPLATHFSSTDDRYLAEFREAVSRAGSHLVDLGLGGQEFYSPDPATRERALAYGRKWIDIAGKLGAPSVRQHLQLSGRQKPDASVATEALARLGEYGAKQNIVVNLENDSAESEDPFVIVAIIERVNNPYLRSLPDFGNTLASHDERYNARGVSAMLSHAWNMCHVKDSVQSEDGRIQHVDLESMFALARQSGYRGYYSMEFDTRAGDPIAGTQDLVRQTLHFLS